MLSVCGLDYDIELPLTMRPKRLNRTLYFSNFKDYENIATIYGATMDSSFSRLLLSMRRQQLQTVWLGEIDAGIL